MTTWDEFAAAEPELAGAVRARFEAHRHHVLATLRADGSPRVSGTEVAWHGPDLTMGTATDAVKARDLVRDPRFALHAHTGDGTLAGGDAKVSGRVTWTTFDHQGASSLRFHCDLEQVVLTTLGPQDAFLRVTSWRAGQSVLTYECWPGEPTRLA